MDSDIWLILAIFCFVIEVAVRALTLRNTAAQIYHGIMIPLGLSFFAISFLSMVARSV